MRCLPEVESDSSVRCWQMAKKPYSSGEKRGGGRNMNGEREGWRSDRERQGREIQKCIQRLNLSLGVFLCQWAALIVAQSLIISVFFIRWMLVRCCASMRMEPDKWASQRFLFLKAGEKYEDENDRIIALKLRNGDQKKKIQLPWNQRVYLTWCNCFAELSNS